MNSSLWGKLSQYLFVIVIIMTLNFLLPRWMPGSPLAYLAGEEVGTMTLAEKEAIMESNGLNKPVGEQYLMYMKSILTGDFGYSYQRKVPITQLISDKLPWTLLLTGLSLVFSTILGITFGTISAWKRGGKTDISLLTGFMFVSAMPSFWVGMILVSIFSAKLGLLPIYGAELGWRHYTGMERVIDIARHLILPLTTLILISITSVYMTMRASMIHVLREDYILMARAKGVKEKMIMYKHVMRNALLPVSTVFMLSLGFMFSGATVIETVFAYPGIGRLMYEAVMSRDYPVIQACFTLITVTVLAANLLADLLYPLIDPKVNYHND